MGRIKGWKRIENKSNFVQYQYIAYRNANTLITIMQTTFQKNWSVIMITDDVERYNKNFSTKEEALDVAKDIMIYRRFR